MIASVSRLVVEDVVNLMPDCPQSTAAAATCARSSSSALSLFFLPLFFEASFGQVGGELLVAVVQPLSLLN